MKIKKTFLLFSLTGIFLLCSFCYGKTRSKTIWKSSSGVKFLYNTPLGTVFQFQFSDQAPWIYVQAKKLPESYKGKLKVLEFKLPDFKGRKKNQYMILEVKIRVFPADSKVKNPNLHIGFGLSSSSNYNSKTYNDLIWMDELHSGCTFSSYLFNNCSQCRSFSLGRMKPPNNYITDASKTPYYEPEKYRFVFSRESEGSIHFKCISCQKIGKKLSFVIFIPKPFKYSKVFDKEKPRTIVEISEPSINFSDKHPDEPDNKTERSGSKKTLDQVSVQPVTYPYNSYSLPDKRINKLKNPDHIYACALKLQEYNPPQALKLFKKLSDNKPRHVLAMYTLDG